MHYLLKCNNAEISHARETFMKNIKTQNDQFRNLSEKNIIDYCMLLKDTSIEMQTSKYVMDILNIYREETDGPAITYNPPVETRIGRRIKKPDKLDL